MKFVEKISDVEVKEDTVAMFVCRISHEDAEVTWHKDGEKIVESEKYTFIRESTYRKLVINDTNIRDDGEYTVVLGEHECSADLVVTELPPRIVSKMANMTVARGEEAWFQVELTKGDAWVRWYKSGKEIRFTEDVSVIIDGKRQRLVIKKAEYEDAGIYACAVGDQTCKARLKVERKCIRCAQIFPFTEKVHANQL